MNARSGSVHLWTLPVLLSVMLIGCGDSGAPAASEAFPPGAKQGVGVDAGAGAGREAGADAAGSMAGPDAATSVDTYVPPEEEVDLPYGAPEPGQSQVFLLSPERGRVVAIDAKTLQIRIADVGADPRAIQVLPGTDEAVVLNLGSADAAWVRVTAEGAVVARAPVVPGSNELRAAPAGNAVLAWYDTRRAKKGDPVGSFQEVSMLRPLPDTGELESVRVAVGFRPVDVQFSADGEVAWVITEQGVSVVDLLAEGPEIVAPPVPVSDDPFEEVTEREVVVDPEGAVAVVRVLGRAEARLVPLDGGPILTIPLPGEPTDLDLIPPGDRVLFVLRESQAAVVLRFRDALEGAPEEALDTVDLSPGRPGVATVSADGKRAVLYTTLSDDEEVTVLDLVDRSARRIPLKKAVRVAAIAPDSGTALLLHRKTSGAEATGEVEAMIDRAEGYSVLQFATGFPKLELLDGAPGRFAYTADGKKLYLLEPITPEGRHRLHQVDLSSTVGRRFDLASTPIDVRYVPAAAKIAVFQEHPAGRITFLSGDGSDIKTLTGFELNSLVD